MFAGGERIDRALLGPLPIVEELFKAIDLVNKFVVVASREWCVWVFSMSDEVCGVNMVGKSFLEEVGQDCELVPCGIIQPLGACSVMFACSSGSSAVCILLLIKIVIDVINHTILDIHNLSDVASSSRVKNNLFSFVI
jgi:hypothetical protein